MKKVSLISFILFCFVFSIAGSAFGQKPAPVIYPDDPMRDWPVLEGFEKQPIVKDPGQPAFPDAPILLSGDCSIIGSDVTRLVNYFRGNVSLLYCPDYEPLWLTPDDLPDQAPDGWPGCE